MRFQQQGDGPTLVMIPGLATTSRFFDSAVAELRRDHRVVLVDLPGHGGEPAPPEPPSIDAIADDLDDLLQRLEPGPVTLLGWSLGATVAYRYLEKYGAGRVRGLISVEQSPLLVCTGEWQHGAFGALDPAGARDLLANLESDPGAFSETLVGSCFATGGSPDAGLLSTLLEQSRHCDSGAVRALLADALEQDWRQGIDIPELPILLLHGAQSAVYPTPVGQWLEQHWRGARLETFAHSGHMPFIDEPEKFCALVRRETASRREADTARAT